MRIIVSDTSCLIDLRKASLLGAFVSLPYEFLIPNTLFEEELLRFTANDLSLLSTGLNIVDLPGETVARAQTVLRTQPALSIHDGFAFCLAESNPGCILLTDGGAMRALGKSSGIETHGLFWAIDQMSTYATATNQDLINALRLFD